MVLRISELFCSIAVAGLYVFSELVANYSRWLPLSIIPSRHAPHDHVSLGGETMRRMQAVPAAAPPPAVVEPVLNFAAHATCDRHGTVRVLLLLKDLNSTSSVNATVGVSVGASSSLLQRAQLQRKTARGFADVSGGNKPVTPQCAGTIARLIEPPGEARLY